MKKTFITILICIILLGVVFAILTYSNKDLLVNNGLSDQEIVSIIKPEVDSYCNILESNATTSSCPTCRIDGYSREGAPTTYSWPLQYAVQKLPNGFRIDAKIPLILGYNTRTRTQIVSFELDNEGSIINKDMPIAECL